MDDAWLESLRNYVVRHLGHMNTYMGPLIDPRGKRILVIGSGWGVETYWCLKNGAAQVIGVDPAERSTVPLEAALRDLNPAYLERFCHHQCTLDALPYHDVDHIISNNVFEHIFDLTGTLMECRRFMSRPQQRLHIFTDPLYYSSVGSHLPVPPWRHLLTDEQTLKAEVPARANWEQFVNGLNKMTLISFLEAIRDAGLYIEKLSVYPDRNKADFTKYAPPGIPPMDAMLEGVACTLAFPENA